MIKKYVGFCKLSFSGSTVWILLLWISHVAYQRINFLEVYCFQIYCIRSVIVLTTFKCVIINFLSHNMMPISGVLIGILCPILLQCSHYSIMSSFSFGISGLLADVIMIFVLNPPHSTVYIVLASCSCAIYYAVAQVKLSTHISTTAGSLALCIL